jgi:hypothetical protein
MNEAYGCRMGLAFLLASVAAAMLPSAAFALHEDPNFGLLILATMIGTPVALGHALLLGLPLYLKLRRKWPLRAWSAVLAGGLIGVVPLFMLMLAFGGLDSGLLWAGGAGMIGGLTFWLAFRGADRKMRT